MKQNMPHLLAAAPELQVKVMFSAHRTNMKAGFANSSPGCQDNMRRSDNGNCYSSSVNIQVWLQEFAWTEDEKAAKIERRSRDGPKGRQLAKEPMFCFEFAMSMLYWSALVYDYGEVRRSSST